MTVSARTLLMLIGAAFVSTSLAVSSSSSDQPADAIAVQPEKSHQPGTHEHNIPSLEDDTLPGASSETKAMSSPPGDEDNDDGEDDEPSLALADGEKRLQTEQQSLSNILDHQGTKIKAVEDVSRSQEGPSDDLFRSKEFKSDPSGNAKNVNDDHSSNNFPIKVKTATGQKNTGKFKDAPVHNHKKRNALFRSESDTGKDRNCATTLTRRKRFDPISMNNNFGGIGQNFVSKKNMDMVEPWSKETSNGLSNGHIKKRSLDTIGSASAFGLGQNFFGKRLPQGNLLESLGKPSFNWFGHDQFSKRDGNSVDSGRSRSDKEENHPEKRQFDSISSNGLSGLEQNYFGKRAIALKDSGSLTAAGANVKDKEMESQFGSGFSKDNDSYVKRFDSISDSGLSGMNQNYFGKRFDSISDSGLSGMNQNYFGKRFDSISNSGLSGMHQNYFGKRFDSISGSGLSGMHQNYFGKRFDSISDSGLSGMHQNYFGKRFDSISDSGLSGMNQNYFGKRFDSISNSGLSGLNQNYFGKRFDSISDSGLSGMHQNYFGKRFDSISDSGLSGMNQNYFGKRFDSIGNSGISGLRQNYFGKRFDSISDSGLSGLRQNYFGKRPFSSPKFDIFGALSKRYFDSIGGSSAINGLSQNFLDKRQFDSISDSAMNGLNQNFFGTEKRPVLNSHDSNVKDHEGNNAKRFDSLGQSSLGALDQRFFAKKALGVNPSDAVSSSHHTPLQGFEKVGEKSGSSTGHPLMSKRNFDVIPSSPYGLLGGNFIEMKKFNPSAYGPRSAGRYFFQKRSDDSVSQDDLGGLKQNPFHKRQFDTIGHSSFLSGMGQNFLDRRSLGLYEPARIGTFLRRHNLRKRSPEIKTSTKSKRSADKRFLDSISGISGLAGLNQNYFGYNSGAPKRTTNLILPHLTDERFSHNAISRAGGWNPAQRGLMHKKNVDSIERFSSFSGMGQNFFGPSSKRGSPWHHLRQSLVSHVSDQKTPEVNTQHVVHEGEAEVKLLQGASNSDFQNDDEDRVQLSESNADNESDENVIDDKASDGHNLSHDVGSDDESPSEDFATESQDILDDNTASSFRQSDLGGSTQTEE